MRAQAKLSQEGRIELTPFLNQDSALLHPFLSCNALLRRLPGAGALDQGDPVEALLIGPLLSAAL